jgi:hypothetical protein
LAGGRPQLTRNLQRIGLAADRLGVGAGLVDMACAPPAATGTAAMRPAIDWPTALAFALGSAMPAGHGG